MLGLGQCTLYSDCCPDYLSICVDGFVPEICGSNQQASPSPPPPPPPPPSPPPPPVSVAEATVPDLTQCGDRLIVFLDSQVCRVNSSRLVTQCGLSYVPSVTFFHSFVCLFVFFFEEKNPRGMHPSNCLRAKYYIVIVARGGMIM